MSVPAGDGYLPSKIEIGDAQFSVGPDEQSETLVQRLGRSGHCANTTLTPLAEKGDPTGRDGTRGSLAVVHCEESAPWRCPPQVVAIFKDQPGTRIGHQFEVVISGSIPPPI
jgi:hypothetical protein